MTSALLPNRPFPSEWGLPLTENLLVDSDLLNNCQYLLHRLQNCFQINLELLLIRIDADEKEGKNENDRAVFIETYGASHGLIANFTREETVVNKICFHKGKTLS